MAGRRVESDMERFTIAKRDVSNHDRLILKILDQQLSFFYYYLLYIYIHTHYEKKGSEAAFLKRSHRAEKRGLSPIWP